MEIKRAGSQSSGKGPAEYFTGTVRIDPLFEAPEPAIVHPLDAGDDQRVGGVAHDAQLFWRQHAHDVPQLPRCETPQQLLAERRGERQLAN